MANKFTYRALTKDFFFKIVTLILLMCAILPSYRSHYTLPIIATTEMIYAFIAFRRFYKTFGRVLIPILVYAIMCFLVAIPFDFKMGFLHPLMSLWIWIFPILLATELIRCKSFETIRFIYYGALVIVFIIIVATIKVMAKNPVVMRDMTAGLDLDYVEQMNNLNVGGYGIAYGCGVILISLIGCVLLYHLNKFNKYFALSLIVIIGMLVIMAQFTTLLIITTGILCYLVLSLNKSQHFKILIILTLIILLLLAKTILAGIINYFNDTVTAYHLQEIYDSLFEDAKYDNTRRQYLSEAIALFIQSPIWGNDVSSGYNALVVYQSHSTIMTILCKTGIIGLCAYIGAFWKAFKPVYKSWDVNTRKTLGKSLIFYFLLLSYLNPTENDIFSYCLGLVSILTVHYFSVSQKKICVKTKKVGRMM